MRGLWAAVVLQALDDLDGEPLGSYDHAQAVAFFTGGGRWRESRVAIADQLDTSADDLARMGRARIKARAIRDAAQPAEITAAAVTQPAGVAPPLVPVAPTPPPARPEPKRTEPPTAPPAAARSFIRSRVQTSRPAPAPRKAHDRQYWVDRFLAKQTG